MFNLNGKNALITGASGGIGGAIAKALYDAGATVALSGTRVAPLEELAASLGDRAHVLPCNLSDADAVNALPKQAAEAMGSVDILVNNAGITRDNIFMRMSDEELLPVSAPFHCALMAPAAAVMAEALSEVTINTPSVPVVANVVAEAVTDPAQIRALLVDQVTGSVRWRESVMWMGAQGVTEAYEIGAGKALSGMIKRIDRGIATQAVGTPDDVAAAAAALK